MNIDIKATTSGIIDAANFSHPESLTVTIGLETVVSPTESVTACLSSSSIA